LKLSGRSDLHCYFWPHAASFLRDNGWFGFLVSSSWLDVEYGFALQEWALGNFRIHAILESTAEPWFEDARVKTCAVIMQRCKDEANRMSNAVKFVRLTVPLPISLPKELEMRDRRDLDLAVFELIGVTDAKERERLRDQLYFETAKYFHEIRIVEIKKQEQRAKSQGRGLRIDELALDVWDALTDDERLSIPEWIESNFAHDWLVTIPDGNPKLPDAEDMLDAATVFFSHTKGARATRLNCSTRAHAEVVYQLGKLGIRGDISLPNPAEKFAGDLSQRFSSIDRRADELARSRSTDESRIEDLATLLKHWMILGKPKTRSA
jgi:hypothetical protein